MRRIGEEDTVDIRVGDGDDCVSACVVVQPGSDTVVIATHPWGPMGGSMHDPHPATACRIFAQAGCSTARFNFRGGINRGWDSMDDVKGVAEWFTKPRAGADRPTASRVLLVGYSYGSIVAAAAAAEIPELLGVVVVNPPIHYAWALYLFNGRTMMAQAATVRQPKLVILGTEDVFCSVATCQDFVDGLAEPKQFVVKEGVDHFGMHRHLPQIIANWIPGAFGVASLEEFASQRGAPCDSAATATASGR